MIRLATVLKAFFYNCLLLSVTKSYVHVPDNPLSSVHMFHFVVQGWFDRRNLLKIRVEVRCESTSHWPKIWHVL